jgi:hypothetical protein
VLSVSGSPRIVAKGDEWQEIIVLLERSSPNFCASRGGQGEMRFQPLGFSG